MLNLMGKGFNKPPATAASGRLKTCLYRAHLSVVQCILGRHRRTVGKYIFSRIFKYPRSIQSRGAFCQDCVSLEQGQVGFHIRPAQGTSKKWSLENSLPVGINLF